MDLTSLEIDKLLGGGKITNAYTVLVKRATTAAQEKVKQAGGEVKLPVQKANKQTEVPVEEEKANKQTEVPVEEEKTEDVENNNG